MLITTLLMSPVWMLSQSNVHTQRVEFPHVVTQDGLAKFLLLFLDFFPQFIPLMIAWSAIGSNVNSSRTRDSSGFACS